MLRTCSSAHLDLAILAVPVQAVDDVAKDLGDVDRDVQGADNAAVAIGQAILDMVKGGVDEDAVVVPRSALHPDGLVHCNQHHSLILRIAGSPSEWEPVLWQVLLRTFPCFPVIPCCCLQSSTHLPQATAHGIAKFVLQDGCLPALMIIT